MLLRSAEAMGSGDPRVVWLASLAVVRALPSELSTGTAVITARATLQRLAAQHGELLNDSAARSVARTSAVQPSPDETTIGALPLLQKTRQFGQRPHPVGLKFEDGWTIPAGNGDSAVSPPDLTPAKALSPKSISPVEPTSTDDATRVSLPLLPSQEGPEGRSVDDTWIDTSLSNAPPEVCSPAFADRVLLGEPTRAAGLYFLLNVLRHLGIAEALQSYPSAAEQGLVPHIMKRLATHAGVEAHDPIWLPINASLPESTDRGSLPVDSPTAVGPKLFPSNLRPSSRETFDVEYFSRAWCVAVRRWCWHLGEVTVREIVNRGGLVSLNRTDLDLTLPLNSVDLRIRRAGLDIDPGWLPWFGKVVRFHYVWDEAAHVY